MPLWKIKNGRYSEGNLASVLDGPKFFAVEASGPKPDRVVDGKRDFVCQIRTVSPNSGDSIVPWSLSCDDPTYDFSNIQWESKGGSWNQRPWAIFDKAATRTTIKESQVLFLVLDQTKELGLWAQCLQEHNMLDVPVIYVFIGNRDQTPRPLKEGLSDAFFSSAHALILTKDTQNGRIYTIAANGCFAPLNDTGGNLKAWKTVPQYAGEIELFEHCTDLGIKVPTAMSRKSPANGVRLGSHWDVANDGIWRVDLDALLQAGHLSNADILNLFAQETLLHLVHLYKARGQYKQFRRFVLSQKNETYPQLEDLSNATSLLNTLLGRGGADVSTRSLLQLQLREAHHHNRQHLHRAILAFKVSPGGAGALKRIENVGIAVKFLDILESNGFRLHKTWSRNDLLKFYAESGPPDDGEVRLRYYDVEGPSFKGTCALCCADDAVMSICLHQPRSRRHNNTNHALNHPLAAGSSPKNMDIISTDNVCFQCALFSPKDSRIFEEQIAAVIPTIEYAGPNKAYIDTQLRMALTQREIATDEFVTQLFMGILNGTIHNQTWASACRKRFQASADPEKNVAQKIRSLEWMLDQFVNKTWVSSPRYLAGYWRSFSSFLQELEEGYQGKGRRSTLLRMDQREFDAVLSLNQRVTSSSKWSTDTVRKMRLSRALREFTQNWFLYSVCPQTKPLPWTSMYQGSQHWLHRQRDYVASLYRNVVSLLTSKEQDGIVPTPEDVDALFTHLLEKHWRLADTFNVDPRDWTFFMRKVQFGVLWMLSRKEKFYEVHLHDSDFQKAINDAAISVPDSEIQNLLACIFTPLDKELFLDPDSAQLHAERVPPFANLWGPSVLRCGVEGCTVPFLALDRDTSVEPHHVDMMKKNRAQHLLHAYGLKHEVENGTYSDWPMKSKNPSSLLGMNVHSSIVKTWIAHSQASRRAVLRDMESSVSPGGQDEYELFIMDVKETSSKHHEGNICEPRFDRYIRDALPSFFSVLAEALRLEGKDEEDITGYKHKFAEKNMESRIRFEMEASALLK